jgi:hypothetical protein
VEVLFTWRELTTIEVTDGAVEFHFRQGVVIARKRAFEAGASQEQFVQAARLLADASRPPQLPSD